jgi:cytochrome P450
MSHVAETEKAEETAALHAATELISESLDRLDSETGLRSDHPLFSRIADSWADEKERARRIGIAHDVVLVHIASMSNLFAAMGWALVDLLEHDGDLDRVRSGDQIWAEQCAMESTRMAQRSIMSRYVLEPVDLFDGTETFHISRGATIATLLPLTNLTSAPGYDAWDPSRWNRRRLADPSLLPAVELVTVFGQGKHTCPAQPFSLSAMTASMAELLCAFDWEPRFESRPVPVRAQIGGVARAEGPSEVSYRKSI